MELVDMTECSPEEERAEHENFVVRAIDLAGPEAKSVKVRFHAWPTDALTVTVQY